MLQTQYKQKKGSFYRSKYRKLQSRIGTSKARVAIANRLARVIYKVLGGYTQYKDLGYMRGDPVEKQIETYVRKLKKLGVDIHHENHQMIVKRKVTVDATGVIQEQTVSSAK